MRLTPAAVAVLLLILLPSAPASAGTLTSSKVKPVSVEPDGDLGESGSSYSTASKSGRYIAFTTSATNLMPGVTPNDKSQLVRKDTKTGKLLVVSRNEAGDLAAESCNGAFLSANGKRIAFHSAADNLDGSSSQTQVFWKDLKTGELRRISESPLGAAANESCFVTSISDDGAKVLIQSTATNLPDGVAGKSHAWVYDADAESLERVTYGAADVDPNQSCSNASLSGNGKYVVFSTLATNMGIPGSYPGGQNVWLRELATHDLTLVSAGAEGQPANSSSSSPSVAKKGRHVAFLSSATNLTSAGTSSGLHLFVFDRVKQKIDVEQVPVTVPATSPYSTRISASGRRILVGLTGLNPNVYEDSIYWAALVDRESDASKVFSITTSDGVALRYDDLLSPVLTRSGAKVVFHSSSAVLDSSEFPKDQVLTAKW